jgi:hypothetical protein
MRAYLRFAPSESRARGHDSRTALEPLHSQPAGLRERARRGLRRLTSDVSEHDLRAIAERGYECAVSNDDVEQAQAVGLFLSDALLQL